MAERPKGAELENEVAVGSWLARDVPADLQVFGSKLGGTPAWIQGDDEIDAARWRFLGQLSFVHEFLTAPHGAHPRLTPGERSLPAANYADGDAYFFLEKDCAAGTTPQARVLWQC